MSFVYPYFLFGLFSISIPILIHLFNLQKPKIVYFPNVFLLKNADNLSKKAIKVKNILILLSRILFLIFLVLAFAQPFIPSRNGVNQAGTVGVYIDNSLSMQSEISGEIALNKAVNNVSNLSESYPSSTLYSLSLNDFKFQNSYLDKIKLKDALSEVDFSKSSRTVMESINRTLAGRKRKDDQLYLFSDFQKSTTGDLSAVSFDSSMKYTFVVLSPDKTSNVYIDSIWIKNPYVTIRENNVVQARIVNEGERSVENLILKLNIDNQQSGTSSVTIAPNSSTVASFNFNLNKGGFKQASLSFEDFPVSFDNEYFFSFKTVELIKIQEIKESAVQPDFVEKVFSNESFFQVKSSTPGSIEYSQLLENDLIILNGLREINKGLGEMLERFIQDNGTILVIPSEKLDLNSYNSFLNRHSIILEKSKNTDSLGLADELAAPEVSNPFFQGIFEEQKEKISMPSEKRVINWNNAGFNILTYKNKSPFISQFVMPAGKIYLFASSLENASAPFSRHALFVPFMYKMAISSVAMNEKLAYHFNDRIISIQLRDKANKETFKLRKDSLEVIPSQRIVGRNLLMEVPNIEMEPGHYELRLEDAVVGFLSLNYNKNESKLESYSAEELKSQFSGEKNIQVLEGIDEKDFVDEIKEINLGVFLWKYCLLLALFFLLIEILLIRYYKTV